MRTMVAASLLCLLTVTPAAAAWTQIQTPHYLFIGDASTGDMKRIAHRFEQFHAVMRRVLSSNAVTFAAPTVIVVFRNRSSFRPYLPLYQGKPREVAGLALGGGPGIQYVAMNAEGGEYAYPVIFHELTHHITHNITRNAALWLSEGVAEYYSTFEIHDDKSVKLGTPVNHHIQLLRERELMPLNELLSANTESEAYNERDRSSLFYAQSWALVHFLVKDVPSFQRFAQFSRAVDQGLSQDQAIEQAYGLDLEALAKELRYYVNQFKFMGVGWRFPNPITDADMTVSVVDDSVALPHLAALLALTDRAPEAEQRATAALKIAPRSAMAHAMLARIKVREQRSDEAREWLEKDSAADSFLDHYTLSVALAEYIGLVGHTTPEGTRAAGALRERAVAAVAKQSGVADAWRLASYGHLLGDDLVQSRTAIERALALAPANERYRLALANLLARQRDFNRARSMLGGLIAFGRTPETRTAAREMMADVVRYERAVASARSANAPPATATTNSPATSDPPARPTDSTPADSERVEPPATPVPGAKPAPRERFIPAFRTVEPGETRVFGTMTAIECSEAGVTIVVQTATRQLRVRARRFESIEFITYRNDKGGKVGCGPRPASETVYVTWKGADTGGDEIRSEAIVVELTPVGQKP